MSKINDGGPAFPTAHDPATHQSGMSLRDYFAAKAMVRIIAQDKDGCMSPDITAMAAYSLADAMIKARQS